MYIAACNITLQWLLLLSFAYLLFHFSLFPPFFHSKASPTVHGWRSTRFKRLVKINYFKEKLYKKNLSHEIRIYQKVKTCEIFHLIISRRRTIFGEKVSINYMTLNFFKKRRKTFWSWESLPIRQLVTCTIIAPTVIPPDFTTKWPVKMEKEIRLQQRQVGRNPQAARAWI